MYVSLVDFCYIVNEHSAKKYEDLISMVIPPTDQNAHEIKRKSLFLLKLFIQMLRKS